MPDQEMRIRRPTTPAQQVQTRTSSSFTGLKEDVPSLKLDDDFIAQEPVGGYAPKPGHGLELEVDRLKRRMEKLEMLLEVYDIPSPPWRER